MPISNSDRSFTPRVRLAIGFTAIINFVIGFAFLFGPELHINLWPTPVPALLSRFIGSIVLANGLGALMIYRQPSWQNARVLVAVALAYGVIMLPFLLYHLLIKDAPPIFWGYAIVDAVFLLPIISVYRKFEAE
jgi:hypothetical protein